MISKLIEDFLEKSGYLLLPSPQPNPLGYNDLLILMHEDTIDPQVDPQAIHCFMGLPNTSVSRTVIKPKSEFTLVHHVGVGPIHWINRARKSHHFFTFGSALSAEHQQESTVYWFQSSVPILVLRNNEDVGSQFAEEAEAMLARQQAHSGLNDVQFWAELALKSPKELYLQTLNYVMDHNTKGGNDLLSQCVQTELARFKD